MSEFFSGFAIGDEAEFRPMYRQQQELGIADEPRDGRVVAVRFTEMKVFYDLLDLYTGSVFRDVDSGKVFKSSFSALPQEVPTTIMSDAFGNTERSGVVVVE